MIRGVHSLAEMVPTLGLLALALSLTASASFRLLGLLVWRRYGRLGRAGAGIALAIFIVLGLLIARLGFLPFKAETFFDGSLWRDFTYIGAAFLLPIIALLRLDTLMGRVASFGVALLVIPVAGISGASFVVSTLLLGGFLPFALTYWPRMRDTHVIYLGYLPAFMLLPALSIGSFSATILTLISFIAFGPALIAIMRLFDDGVEIGAIAANDKTTEAELKAAPLISRTIADLPEGIALFDTHDRLIAFNETYRRFNSTVADLLILGTAYADLTRASLLRCDQVLSDPEALIADHLACHQQLPWRFETITPDNRTLLVVESRTAEGGTLRLMTDVTAIKGREQRLLELSQNNEALVTVIGAVSCGIVICDATRPDCPVTFVNKAFTKITGYSSEEMMGRNCRILQGRDTDPEMLDRLRRALAQSRQVSVTLRNYRKDGRTFWNELAISPIFDDKGRLLQLVGVVNDVTQRMRAEESLRDSKKQAELANRAKSDFLATVSHELRTPLNAILGFSEMMKMEFFGALGQPRYKTYAENVFNSGNLLLSLINDILDLSKIESGKIELHPEPVALLDVFNSAITLMQARAQEGDVELKSAIASDLPSLYVDLRAVKQIVNNLVSNAVKFTPKGGLVALTARRYDTALAEIVIEDTGIGIPKEHLVDVMKPFVQVDSQLQRRQLGTGLGLSIAHHLAELCDGSLAIKSVPGQGTHVTLRLPLYDEKLLRNAG